MGIPSSWTIARTHARPRGEQCQAVTYSRSPKSPALQQLQKSSKSASTTPQRPIWNSFATVGVRDFWENGCNRSLHLYPHQGQLSGVGECDSVAAATRSAGGDAGGDADRRRGRHATPDYPPLGGDGEADKGDPTAGSVPSVAGGSDSSDKVATDGSPPRRQWGGAPATRRRRGMRRLSRRLASPTRRRIR